MTWKKDKDSFSVEQAIDASKWDKRSTWLTIIRERKESEQKKFSSKEVKLAFELMEVDAEKRKRGSYPIRYFYERVF